MIDALQQALLAEPLQAIGPGKSARTDCTGLRGFTLWRVSAAVAAMLFLGCAGARAAEPHNALRVGTTGDHPPYSELVQNNTFVGIDIDLARDLAASMGRPVVFVKATWSKLISDLVTGRYHLAMSGIHITAEREAAARFSHPYLAVGTQALLRCDDVARFRTLDDVNRMGVQVLSTLGGTNHAFVREYIPNAAVLPVVGASHTFERLAAGEGDLAFGNTLRVEYAARHDSRLCVGLQGTVYDVHSVGILAAPHSTDLPVVNRWVERRSSDGLIERVVAAHADVR